MIQHQTRIKKLKMLINLPNEDDERLTKLNQIEEEWYARDYRKSKRKNLILSRKSIPLRQIENEY